MRASNILAIINRFLLNSLQNCIICQGARSDITFLRQSEYVDLIVCEEACYLVVFNLNIEDVCAIRDQEVDILFCLMMHKSEKYVFLRHSCEDDNDILKAVNS